MTFVKVLNSQRQLLNDSTLLYQHVLHFLSVSFPYSAEKHQNMFLSLPFVPVHKAENTLRQKRKPAPPMILLLFSYIC